MAAEFEFNNGYQIPVAYLAKKLADENQIYTQVRAKRWAACCQTEAMVMLALAVRSECAAKQTTILTSQTTCDYWPPIAARLPEIAGCDYDSGRR